GRAINLDRLKVEDTEPPEIEWPSRRRVQIVECPIHVDAHVTVVIHSGWVARRQLFGRRTAHGRCRVPRTTGHQPNPTEAAELLVECWSMCMLQLFHGEELSEAFLPASFESFHLAAHRRCRFRHDYRIQALSLDS